MKAKSLSSSHIRTTTSSHSTASNWRSPKHADENTTPSTCITTTTPSPDMAKGRKKKAQAARLLRAALEKVQPTGTAVPKPPVNSVEPASQRLEEASATISKDPPSEPIESCNGEGSISPKSSFDKETVHEEDTSR